MMSLENRAFGPWLALSAGVLGLRIALVLTTLALPVFGQEVRLVDRIERPLLYLRTGEPGQAGVLERLFEDPLLGPWMGTGSGSASMLSSFAGLVRSSQELELAMTGLIPRPQSGALPLLVVRVCLEADSSERVGALFAGSSIVQPSRKLAGQQVYRLPGSSIELFLSDDELLVSNHRQAMEGLLEPVRGRQPLSREDSYQALTGRLGYEKPDLLVFCDWEPLWAKIRSSLDTGERLAVDLLGLGQMRHLVFATQRDGDAVRSGLLARPRGELQGMLSVADSVSVADLVSGLDMAGFAALSMSFDPTLLGDGREQAPSAALFASVLDEQVSRIGLELEEQVLPRLGREGSFRLLWDGERGDLRTAFTVSAKNRRAARDLFSDSVAAFDGLGFLDGRPTADAARLSLPEGGSASFAWVRDRLILGSEPKVLSLVDATDRAMTANQTRSLRSRMRTELKQLIGRRSDRAVGAFFLDFDRLTQSLGRGGETSLLRGRHLGLVSMDLGHLRVDLIARP